MTTHVFLLHINDQMNIVTHIFLYLLTNIAAQY